MVKSINRLIDITTPTGSILRWKIYYFCAKTRVVFTFGTAEKKEAQKYTQEILASKNPEELIPQDIRSVLDTFECTK
jgi:hypothetical protein